MSLVADLQLVKCLPGLTLRPLVNAGADERVGHDNRFVDQDPVKVVLLSRSILLSKLALLDLVVKRLLLITNLGDERRTTLRSRLLSLIPTEKSG